MQIDGHIVVLKAYLGTKVASIETERGQRATLGKYQIRLFCKSDFHTCTRTDR